MQKVIRFLLSFMMAIPMMSFHAPTKDKINWITVQQLNEIYYNNPRPIIVDVYTDWCGWCKHMDKTTYTNSKVVSYINEHYYAVKLNAEAADNLIFNKKNYRSSELAEFLLARSMEFPTTVFLSSIDAQPAPLAGYMKPKEMEAPLKYFGGEAHRTQSFVEFNKGMKKEW